MKTRVLQYNSASRRRERKFCKTKELFRGENGMIEGIIQPVELPRKALSVLSFYQIAPLLQAWRLGDEGARYRSAGD